ncbi:MAG: HD domain-containing protein [Terrisporobacter sp.]|uniref:HD domain-containing protein n=1 Tax=Terrisporobacter sp. TaxID=1965305 RepID=UPI002FCB8D84
MREEALELLQKYLKTDYMLKHSFAVEAVMREVAKKLEPEKEEKWAIAGLLHDLDSDITGREPGVVNDAHAFKTVELLKEEAYGDEELYRAILGHHDDKGVVRESLMEKAIYAVDPITGFITAIAKGYPDKKITSVKTKSVIKRMKEKRFAANANRDAMRAIELTGMNFDEFAELALHAMQDIAEVLEEA